MEEIIIKQGLLFEDGELRYYKDDELYHAGVICDGDDIYYINSQGKAVKGEYVIHGVMSNGILKHGTYAFDEDYKLIKDSYRAPKKRNSHSTTRQKQKKFSAEQRKQLLAVALLLAFIIASVCFVANLEDLPFINADNPNGSSWESEQTILLPEFEQEVLLCSSTAKQAFDHTLDLDEAISQEIPYRPFVFEYQLTKSSGVLRLSENSNLTNYTDYILDKYDTSIEINNLKTGTTYYYRVTVNDNVYSGTFRTAQSNRFLLIPGIKNVRDIGGYTTLDGRTVKQGLLIRGCEIDGAINPPYFIPEKDIPSVLETFGFKYDMDLRVPLTNDVFETRFGSDVKHKFYSAPSYEAIFEKEYINSVREIFTDLANPKNYPMYMHCSWGADRTGTIVFLLQGLLNVSKEDMLHEYRLSGFVMENFHKNTNIDALIAGLESYEGNTMQEKITNYLTKTVGITNEQIESIKTIFLD